MVTLSEKEQQYFQCLERKERVNKSYRISGYVMLLYTLSIFIGNIIYIIVCVENLVMNHSLFTAYPLVKGSRMENTIEDIVEKFPKVGFVNVMIILIGALIFVGILFSCKMRIGSVSLVMTYGCALTSVFLAVAAFLSDMGTWLGLSLSLYCLVMAFCSYIELRSFREEEDLKKQEGYPDFNALLLREEAEIPPLPPDATPDDVLMQWRNGGYTSRR